jgi:hypothetical protein
VLFKLFEKVQNMLFGDARVNALDSPAQVLRHVAVRVEGMQQDLDGTSLTWPEHAP